MALFPKRIPEIVLVAICMGTLLLSAGCAGAPDISGPARSISPDGGAADPRQLAVDQPFMVSGDYFREKNTEEGVNLNLKLGGEEKKSQASSALEKRVARLESKVAGTSGEGGSASAPGSPATAPPASSATASMAPENVPPAGSVAAATKEGSGMRIKVGMLVDRRGVDREGARLLSNAAYITSVRFPVVPVSPREISEALARKAAAEQGDLGQVTREIAVYPGVRMLVLIDAFRIPESYPGKAEASVNVMDAGTGHHYPLPVMTAAVKDSADVDIFAKTVMGEAFERATDHSGLMPWFCRVFAREGERFYVNAGMRSGLRPGDRLTVVAGGKLVKAPSGVPAGWIPGPSTGVLQVDLNFGKDLSACSLVEGEAPSEAAILTKP